MLLRRVNFWLVGMIALVSGCATRVVPPSNPANPVAVYVTDYGRHSSILLPMGDGHLMEYSYGDWDFYALNKYKWYAGPTKLFLSDGSGLGRRILAHPGDDEALQKMINSKRLLRVEIEQSKVRDLLAELDQRYCAKIETMVYNNYGHSYFVKDESHYWLFHTCNAMTQQWLEKLGCKVSGLAVISNFELDRPKMEAVAKVKKEPHMQYARQGAGVEPVQLSQRQARDAQAKPSATQQQVQGAQGRPSATQQVSMGQR
jgi:hypothetical protein